MESVACSGFGGLFTFDLWLLFGGTFLGWISRFGFVGFLVFFHRFLQGFQFFAGLFGCGFGSGHGFLQFFGADFQGIAFFGGGFQFCADSGQGFCLTQGFFPQRGNLSDGGFVGVFGLVSTFLLAGCRCFSESICFFSSAD